MTRAVAANADPGRIREFAARIVALRQALDARIVGQRAVIDQVLAAILAEGHVLLVGVPGLAKTLLVQSIAELLSLDFRRIQFTPDLMPTDITGATLIRDDAQGHRGFHFFRGPIFANVILADEINRTPPKTQAALMEAMEERQVTAGGARHRLDRPFVVLATQNPIEQEGTYPLPVSQLDRFLFRVHVDYPSSTEEFDIVLRTTSSYASRLEPVLSRAEIDEMTSLAARVAIPEDLLTYASEIVRRTRPDAEAVPDFIRESISWGAGPRGVQALLAGGRSMALLAGRALVTAEDLHAVAHPVLRHRLVLTYHAQAEGHSPDDLISRILESLGRWTRPVAPDDRRMREGFWRRWVPRRA